MSDQAGHGLQVPKEAVQIRSRSYQKEMFERSMKGNVIIAMDTGSGKTHIAILRIMEELERCDPDKLIWFLAPTVSLCTQQLRSIELQIPAARARLLIGSDNVDCWSDQKIWDAALKDIQVVVSTHAILQDALTHGFVKVDRLTLLIFDEAHHCTKNHPANVIMRDFYHHAKLKGSSIPHIMGLSASPVFGSKVESLQQLESNLDSISVTPRDNRHDLLKHVHHPKIYGLDYPIYDIANGAVSAKLFHRLSNIYSRVPTSCSVNELTLLTPGCQKPNKIRSTLKKFYKKAEHIFEELGPWAVEYYIRESIIELTKTEADPLDDWKPKLEALLVPILDPKFDGLVSTNKVIAPIEVSPKVEELISFLRHQQDEDVSGLVFAKQRVVVSILCRLLSIHPETKKRFRCATFVGQSSSSRRQNGIAELLDLKAQRETLEEFRARKKNLVIATDVLEEGIDVTACNLVICFDSPPNMKSFIQRRGRARQAESKLAIMVPDDKGSRIQQWLDTERRLVELYRSDREKVAAIEQMENFEEIMNYRYEIESTGAVLTAGTALSHLHHFCAVLPHEPYTNLHPEFSIVETGLEMWIATVTLPNCVPSKVRSTKGRKSWRTERAAIKDAAFHAYVALYTIGLINDNLLPLTSEWIEKKEQMGRLPQKVEIPSQSVLQSIPQSLRSEELKSADYYRTHLSVVDRNALNGLKLSMVLITPFKFCSIPSLELYWSENETYAIDFGTSEKVHPLDAETLLSMREITHLLHRSFHSDRSKCSERDFLHLFAPDIQTSQLPEWLEKNGGRVNALKLFRMNKDRVKGIIRSLSQLGTPYVFHGWKLDSSTSGDDELSIDCVPLLKRRNFLARNMLSKAGPDATHISTLPADDCEVDLLPFKYVRFGLFIPSILRHIDQFELANRVRKVVLRDGMIEDPKLIVTAISASSANCSTNYQWLEFIGDTILKFIVSFQLYVDYATWPERFLSEYRSLLVSNERLSSAALEKGLGRYIITESIRTKGWTPSLLSVSTSQPATREIARKVLADVVEALVGAAYIETGLGAARLCANSFVPDISPLAPKLEPPVKEVGQFHEVSKAESVIGYHFTSKVLLREALTHPSYGIDATTQSYQRLEFLGDAVLDMLIVSYLAKQEPSLSEGRMTQLRAAIVNNDLLGFMCLDYSVPRETISIEEIRPNVFVKREGTENVCLWQFMRHHSSDIGKIQQACRERYKGQHGQIRSAMNSGTRHPWVEIAQLRAPKFFADLIESIIGAIFIDSQGNLSACEAFIDRIGLTRYAHRIKRQETDVLHPRDRLQRHVGSSELDFTFEDSDGEGFKCTVAVDGKDVTQSIGCPCKDQALVLAADAALGLLSSQGEKHGRTVREEESL